MLDQYKFGAERFRIINRFIENALDEVETKATWFDLIERAPGELSGIDRRAEIPQPEAQRISLPFAHKGDRMGSGRTVGMPDDIGTSFIDPQHQGFAFPLWNLLCFQKMTDECPRSGEIFRMAGKLKNSAAH